MRPFQAILLAIFGFFIIAGVIALATFGNVGGGGDVTAEAEIWGTLPSEAVNRVVSRYNDAHEGALVVTYQEFLPESFDAELVDAIAAGRGPDAVIITDEQVVRYEDKLYIVPFTSISERLFRDTHIAGAELFLTREGVLALPILVDPLVLYWNRTLFNNARIPNPPSYWDELIGMGERITVVDESFNVTRSVIALGEYANIDHAKEIITALILQAGNPITLRDAAGRVGVIMDEDLGLPEAPADSALRFYTEFANPVKPVYSWNRALPSSRNMFLRGDLALYLGFGSELLGLNEENPNLDFDLAPVPQVRDSTLEATFGRMYGLSLIKQSDNLAGAFSAITILSGREAAGFFAEELGLSPTRRDLLSTAPADPYQTILYDEALITASFLDPDPPATDGLFRDMVADITSGRLPVSRAVSNASARLKQLFE
jgi:ABC-type glycerol-3-phosphate transport system substrate-binding protein